MFRTFTLKPRTQKAHHISSLIPLAYSKEWKEILQRTSSDETRGLTEKEATLRLRKFGRNQLPQQKSLPALFIFLNQFKSPLILILVGAGVVTLFLQEFTDSTVIFGAVVLNATIGYIQEKRATDSLSALKRVLKPQAIVLREHKEKQILQTELVPGDIIILQAGDLVPADARVIESWDLKTTEAVLTGEWMASNKHSNALPKETQLADRENMVYMGSTVEAGKGKAVVVATGEYTEFGKIALLVQSAKEEKTPYQQRLTRFSWIIGAGISILTALIFIEGLVAKQPLLEMFEVTVAIVVGAIPEGLPVAMTIVLAIGMQRILSRKGLVRHLRSAETLGSTSIIATDKTLTLTEGKMQVDQVFALEPAAREEVLTGAALANEAFIENRDAPLEQWIIRGRPTDTALMRAAVEAGLSTPDLEQHLPKLFQIPFSSDTKYIASFHKKGASGIIAYVAGAPEQLLSQAKLSPSKQALFEQQLQDWTAKGMRVVAIASKSITKTKQLTSQLKAEQTKESATQPAQQSSRQTLSQQFQETLTDLSLLGLVALKDPLRKETKAAIQATQRAGLRVVIVTGDHMLTAKAVAQELGLPMKEGAVVEGKDLDRMSDEELNKRLSNIVVYARVEPAHKMRIIEAWQRRGEVIAMTGDGVNDAPALKKADIGLALGSGSEVAKETADLILLSDNFSIIPAAIQEGRVIGDNIRKIITYMLSGSFTETILIGVGILAGAPFLPITAVQILWVNLVADGLPGMALTAEKPEHDVMAHPPQKKDSPLLTGEMKVIIFAIGIFTDLVLLGLFFWLLHTAHYTPEHIQTFMFIGLGSASLFYAFSIKSLRKNIWQYNPFNNMFLLWTVAIGFLGLIATVYVPFLSKLLGTVPLALYDWMLLLALGLLNILLIEAAKWYFTKKI